MVAVDTDTGLVTRIAEDVEVAGMFAINHRAFFALIDSLARSYLFAIVVIREHKNLSEGQIHAA